MQGQDQKQTGSKKLELLLPIQGILVEFFSKWEVWSAWEFQELWEALDFGISLVLCGIKIPPKSSWWAELGAPREEIPWKISLIEGKDKETLPNNSQETPSR